MASQYSISRITGSETSALALFISSSAGIAQLGVIGLIIGPASYDSTDAVMATRWTLQRGDGVSVSGTALTKAKMDSGYSASDSGVDGRYGSTAPSGEVLLAITMPYDNSPQPWIDFPAKIVVRPGSNANSLHLVEAEAGTGNYAKSLFWEEP